MGNSTYDLSSRSTRSASEGYYTKSVDQIFTQQKERCVHHDMDPKNISLRECRDSESHPNVIPVILALDVTGSMGHIPHLLIKDGLPTLMGGLTQKGVDSSLLFLAVGDHECDKFPLQVGQFESGDEELDLWLTRTYLEGGGGGNSGESYLLAWHFASNYVETDSWDKRKKKGFLFTVGDEPNLRSLPKRAIQSIYGSESGESTDAESALAAAQEKFEVYHLHVTHHSIAKKSLSGWKDALGQSCIEVSDYKEIPKIITNIISGRYTDEPEAGVTETESPKTNPAKTEEVVDML